MVAKIRRETGEAVPGGKVHVMVGGGTGSGDRGARRVAAEVGQGDGPGAASRAGREGGSAAAASPHGDGRPGEARAAAFPQQAHPRGQDVEHQIGRDRLVGCVRYGHADAVGAGRRGGAAQNTRGGVQRQPGRQIGAGPGVRLLVGEKLSVDPGRRVHRIATVQTVSVDTTH